MKQAIVAVAMLGIIIAVALGQTGTGEKTAIYAYKTVTYSVSGAKVIDYPSTPAAQVYYCFDPSHGDSATNGVDSLATGLMYDTLECYFDISNYTHVWLCWGFEAWPYTSADEDSHRVEIDAAYGTEKFGSGNYDRWIYMNGRGLDADTMALDTLLVPDSDTLTLYDSLFIIPLETQIAGGDSDLDSASVLDAIRMRFIFVDSALVGDAVNKSYYTVRCGLIGKHD